MKQTLIGITEMCEVHLKAKEFKFTLVRVKHTDFYLESSTSELDYVFDKRNGNKFYTFHGLNEPCR